jgi:hypothetical protein
MIRAEDRAVQLFKVVPLGRDLRTNPCREMLAGGLCPPSSKHFKRKIL